MNITPNPNNFDSSIISNKDLLVLLITHLEYVKSLRNNIFVKLSANQIEFLDNKINKLSHKIEYLMSKLSIEDLLDIDINKIHEY
jgi:hypothetical protein